MPRDDRRGRRRNQPRAAAHLPDAAAPNVTSPPSASTNHPPVHVDQSGRTDDYTKPTVVAVSNGSVKRTLLVPVPVKLEHAQHLQNRRKREPWISIRLLAAAIVLLLEPDADQFPSVQIDVEYQGWDRELTGLINQGLVRRFPSVDRRLVVFRHIGATPPAHHLALHTLRGALRPTRIATLAEVIGAFNP